MTGTNSITRLSLLEIFTKELNQESVTTKKMLERIPDDKFDYKPHKKSMTIRQLATHIAELSGWISMTLHTSGLDFASNPYQPEVINNTKDLLSSFERHLAQARIDLASAKEEQLDETWTLSNGPVVLLECTKAEVIRMSLNQIVHHRAQLGVFLRLLDIPIPGSYGPSADEHNAG